MKMRTWSKILCKKVVTLQPFCIKSLNNYVVPVHFPSVTWSVTFSVTSRNILIFMLIIMVFFSMSIITRFVYTLVNTHVRHIGGFIWSHLYRTSTFGVSQIFIFTRQNRPIASHRVPWCPALVLKWRFRHSENVSMCLIKVLKMAICPL